MEKKNIRYYQIFSGVLVILALAFIFVRNNTEVFSSQKPLASDNPAVETSRDESVKDTAGREFVATNQRAISDTAAGSKQYGYENARKNKSARGTGGYVVEINDVECKFADREDLTLVVSLKFTCSDGKVRRDVLFKREDLKVIVKKVIFSMKLEGIQVDDLSSRIKSATCEVVEKGAITDVEFTRFELM